MTREEVSKVLAMLSAAYRVRVEPETLHVYARALDRAPFEPYARGAGDLINHAEFFPTVAALHKAAAPYLKARTPMCHVCGGLVVATIGREDLCLEHLPSVLEARRSEGPALAAPRASQADIRKLIKEVLAERSPPTRGPSRDAAPSSGNK